MSFLFYFIYLWKILEKMYNSVSLGCLPVISGHKYCIYNCVSIFYV